MISIIVPFHNEEENLPLLIDEINQSLKEIDQELQLILVNDGSTDNWQKAVENRQLNHGRIEIINLRKKFGKGEALAQGIKRVKGEVIIFMDGDLQDDPQYIPEFLKKIQDGADFVNGRRTNRQDSFVIRIYSKIFNSFIRNFMNSPVNDINCGFKAMKKVVLDEIAVYGNSFRFLPLAANFKGFKVTELSLINRPRKYGKSKFGPGKIFTGLLDTLRAYFIYQFSEKPLYFFGAIGGSLFLVGFIIGLYLSIERIFFGMLLYRRPALWLAVLLIIVGIQIIMTGMIGELIVYMNKKK